MPSFEERRPTGIQPIAYDPDNDVEEDEEDDENDDVHHVGVEDISAVAHELGLPVATIVNSMVLEAQRQQQEGMTSSATTSGSLHSPKPPHFKSPNIPGGPAEDTSLLPPTLRSVRVSLANVTNAVDYDEERGVMTSSDDAMEREGSRKSLNSGPLTLGSSRSIDGGANIKHSPGTHVAVASTPPLASSPPPSVPVGKRLVRFAASEIERVHVYEVDNSLFISVEYSRPLLGWMLLLTAIVTGAVTDVLNVFTMASGTHNLYPTLAWSDGIGQGIVLIGFLLPAWYFLVKPTRIERQFLSSKSGVLLVTATGILGALSIVSTATSAHLMGQWRAMALSAIHAPLIVLFGKVFRNTVFLEEVIGSGVFLVCFILATLPVDIQSSHWEFAEVLSLSNGIYTASFLFLAVKARTHRVSVPVIAAAVSLFKLLFFIVVCAAAGASFGSHNTRIFPPSRNVAGDASSAMSSADVSSSDAVFAFAENETYVARWLAASLCYAASATCYLMTLRFIPPLTVSVSLCLQALVAQFAAYLLFFNAATAPWPVCPVVATNLFPGTTSTTTPVPESLEQATYCGGNGYTVSARNVLFTVGSCIAVISGGYLVYVSSIKRSKVDRLLKQISNRKVPKNPYQNRGNRTPTSQSSGESPTAALDGIPIHQRAPMVQEKRRDRMQARLLLSAVPKRQSPITTPQVVVGSAGQGQSLPRRIARGSVVESDAQSLSTMDPSTPTEVACPRVSSVTRVSPQVHPHTMRTGTARGNITVVLHGVASQQESSHTNHDAGQSPHQQPLLHDDYYDEVH